MAKKLNKHTSTIVVKDIIIYYFIVSVIQHIQCRIDIN